MTEVRIRNVDDWVVELHRHQAKLAGRSLEGRSGSYSPTPLWRRRRESRTKGGQQLEAFRQKYGTFPDSAALIREDRDSRG